MENLHRVLMRTDYTILKNVLSKASAIGLTPGQPKILEFLYPDLETDQKTIAANCFIEQATVGSILLNMEKKGLVERFRKDGNRRSLYVKLTNKGKNKAEEMLNIFSFIDEEATKLLTDDGKKEIIVLLNKICEALNDK